MNPTYPHDSHDDATAELTLDLSGVTQELEADDAGPFFTPFTPRRIDKPVPNAPRGFQQVPVSTVGLQPQRKQIGKGSTVCQRYVLEEQIGLGGTSVVYRARDLRREQHRVGEAHIALKTPRIELPTYPQAVERLKREFRLAQTLTHPHVVRIFDLDQEDDRWFMTMELLEGKTLAAALAQSPFSSDHPPFPARRAADILRACGEALAFAHDHGVVHGDFKPGNIFLPVSGPLRVLDFGAATSTEVSLEPHAPAATACYASPEVLSGLRPDRRDDIFSFACVAHELLGGVHPFERRSALEASKTGGKPLRSWNLTDRQWYALEEALAFNRAARPGNIRTLLGELFPASLLDRVEIPERIDVAEPMQAAASWERISAMVIPPLDSPMDEFRKSSARSSLGVFAIAFVVLLAAVTAYVQLNRHPQWPEQLRAQSLQIFNDAKAKIQTVVDSANEASPAPPAPPVPAPAPALASAPEPAPNNTPKPSGGVSVARASKQTLSGAEAFGLPLSQASPEKSSRSFRRREVSAPAPLDIFVSFADQSITVDEGANSAVLRLKRDGNLDARTDVHWRAVPGTARPGEDFVPGASGVAVFASGQSGRTIYIPLLRDAIDEPNEEFFVELYDPADGTQIWPTARAKIVIRDDN